MWHTPENKYLLAGHRGERIRGDENTLPAFERAIACGVDMIETDVRITSDGALILLHDKTLDRTTNGTGDVHELTLAQIRRYNAAPGQPFTPVPTLDEFLALIDKHPTMLLDIELKDYPERIGLTEALRMTDRVLELLTAHGLRERCVINSSSGTLLAYVAKTYPGMWRLHGYYPYSLLSGEPGDPSAYLYCACVYPPKGMSVPPREYFDALTSQGIEPWSHTGIDTLEQLRVSYLRGARLITADDPARILGYLRELGLHA
ncbi:MAG: glycerophosphodiester phosphodiesterase family protein [Clostridiales bacterium]|jgi:glycerophosphoryl diester phosphodiesterase|nr:glycerophosphodiester phosphodiesterase family protein [Clostridiales bacterium]